MAKTPEEQLKAIREWQKINSRTYCLRLNQNEDSDIITWLESQESKNGAIKALIRQEIARESEEEEEADTEPDNFEDWGYTPADD